VIMWRVGVTICSSKHNNALCVFVDQHVTIKYIKMLSDA